MNEIKASAIAERLDIRARLHRIDGLVQCRESIESENRIIEIATAFSIFEPTVLIALRLQELNNELRGVGAQYLGRESGDLQHFQADAHVRDGTSRQQSVQDMR